MLEPRELCHEPLRLTRAREASVPSDGAGGFAGAEAPIAGLDRALGAGIVVDVEDDLVSAVE
jgi:hypothetical protein